MILPWSNCVNMALLIKDAKVTCECKVKLGMNRVFWGLRAVKRKCRSTLT